MSQKVDNRMSTLLVRSEVWKRKSSLPKVPAPIEPMARFTAYASFCDSYNVSVWVAVNNVKKSVNVLMHLQAFSDSYGTKYASYDVALAMKTVFLLALLREEFINPYITVN